MRIAVGGLHTDRSPDDPVVANAADFRSLRGPAVLTDA